MIYNAFVFGADAQLSVEREGLRLGARFLDYADVKALTPLNHRVLIDTLEGERIEVSMLGFSYDGFWEELYGCFADKSRESLFVEENAVMLCEGEFETPNEKGRAKIELYPDAVCILPPSCGAVRVPLCFTDEIRVDGYMLRLKTYSGEEYSIGRMGYDTMPFAERAAVAADKTKKERAARLSEIKPSPPFTQAGLFRTATPQLFWNAAFGNGCCAVELFTDDDSATYLYRFSEPRERFSALLQEAMEAVGTHREIIFLPDDKLEEKPLYRMSRARCGAVRYLRSRSAGRLIHNAGHSGRLEEFLS